MDLKLSIPDHDLDVSSNDLELVSGVDAIAQHLRIRYRFFLGEWFLDTREGIPYYQRVLVKNPNIPDVNSILRAVAATTPGVAEVERFDFEFDARSREFSYDFWGRTETGESLQYTDAFIVGGS